ncbi:NAD(P)H-binding protein [Jiangella anatolica]|uniref:Hydroxylase n=1 Tax=Jiangella anatolica TaxID=2670374 RepID=A0A2W2B949_9ACTN|nr:NAD(P)H-binding protein [Jiangella anatolica]PZF81710.1 hydroxylase [Jiangella anatolica]
MTILVTGATGSVGRLVVDHLLARGAIGVRALVRNPAKASLPDGVEVLTGYVAEPTTLDGVFDGVDRLYLTSYTETAAEVLARANKAGVQHVVSLSGEPDSWWGSIVADVEAAGIPWTHLWPGEFMENSTIWADQIRTTGQVRDGYARSANAAIAMDDVAAVAAVALTEDGHVGRAYELTGPETLTRAEKVARIGAALGRDVPYVELSREDAIAQLTPVMGEYAEWYVDGEADQVDARQQPTTTVADVLGRPAETFADWAVRNVTLFR